MTVRGLAKRLLYPVLKPLYDYYSRRPRSYSYQGLTLKVLPSVFHPGLFLSTTILADFVVRQEPKGRSLLELGAGSGLVSLAASRAGAEVTASDINPQAVENVRLNAELTGLEVEAVESDLFSNLADRQFDHIVINPPYYPKAPSSDAEKAFYCGPEFEYFQRLFADMHAHLNPNGRVTMILSEDCDLERISNLARQHGWAWEEVEKQRKMQEWNYLFRITPASGAGSA